MSDVVPGRAGSGPERSNGPIGPLETARWSARPRSLSSSDATYSSQAVLGRATEREAVRRLLDEGRSVLVTGAAGIGKSTLARAVLLDRPHAAGGGVAGLRWYRYLPLLRAVGGALEGEPDAVVSAVVRALDGRALLIDDLHWVDDGTMAALGRLVDLVPVLATCRDNEPPPPWADTVDHVPIGPLSRRTARRLATRMHPDLSTDALDRLLDAADGNPLLLGALAGDGVTSLTLQAAVAERLRHLPRHAHEAVALLAIHDRPLPAQILPSVADLPDFLVEVAGGQARLRHQTFGPAARATMDENEQVRLRRRLADRLPPAEAAEHLLAVGDRRAASSALRAALEGAGSHAIRAHLLGLLADADDDDSLRLEAARSLVKVGDLDGGLRLAQQVSDGRGPLAAEGALAASQALWFRGEVEHARLMGEQGLDLAAGDGILTARLTVELAHQRVRGDQTDAPTLALAEEALARAERAGVEVGRARLVLARAAVGARRHDWEAMHEIAIAAADREGDSDSACAGRFYLASHLGFAGRFDEAISVLEEGIEAATTLGEQVWRTHMASALLTDRFMVGGAPEDLAAEAAAFVTDHPGFRNRAQPELALILSLADLGRDGEAQQALARALTALKGDENRSILLTAGAEAAWLAGDLDNAIALAEESAALLPGWFGISAGGVAAGAYARFEAGATVEVEPPAGMVSITASFGPEVEGLRRWSAGDQAGALDRFDEVTNRLGPRIPQRYVARAAWAAATIAEQAGRSDAGARARHAAERATAMGLVPLRRRMGHGTRAGLGLTPRQAEILALVGDGLTSGAIADRLGLARSTVDSHIAAARRRLGARTRRQAVTMTEPDQP